MRIIYNNKVLCEIPDSMSVVDFIIHDGITYTICKKTYSNDNKEFYAEVNKNSDDNAFHKLITDIYCSDELKTSGVNTNNIISNPRLISVLIVAASIIDEHHMKLNGYRYKNNIIARWNQGSIKWTKIFDDNPPLKDDITNIYNNIRSLLIQSKISKKVWPKSLL
ncbi:MAG: hypothetical protein ACOC3V_01285 [bacterium]